MTATSLVREQLKQAFQFLMETADDVTTEQAHWIPPGRAHPLGAIYAHAILQLDEVIAQLNQSAPLFKTIFAGKTGISKPRVKPSLEWARSVSVDLPALKPYAQAVYKTADKYIQSLNDKDLGRRMGPWKLEQVLGQMGIAHLNNMTGEISCLKGLQGAKGYPV